jgi:tetratricopeptide (TPR) repeat protein
MKKTLATLSLFALLPLAGMPSVAAAEVNCEEPREASGSLSEFTYRRLTRIQEDIAEEKYSDAIEGARKLLPKVERNDYEKALVYQTEAFAWASQEDYKNAIPAFVKAIDLNALPQQQHEQMLNNVGQLYYAVEDRDSALKYLKRYLDETCSDPAPDAYILIASIYVDRKQYRSALPYVDKAIRARKDVPETWYQLKLAIHYEQKQFKQAAEVLVTLIANHPIKEDYWKQLSGVFLEMKDDPESLAVLALAGRQGFLDTEREIENLANVYLFLEIPYKAAQVLTDGMNAGIVDKTLESLEKLGTAWQMARENAQALSVFAEAAPLAADGRIWHRLGQIYIDDENWPKAEEALKNALAKGVNDRGETQLLVGVAAWNQGKTDQARSAFLAARNDSATKSQAQAWLAHLATEG